MSGKTVSAVEPVYVEDGSPNDRYVFLDNWAAYQKLMKQVRLAREKPLAKNQYDKDGNFLLLTDVDRDRLKHD